MNRDLYTDEFRNLKFLKSHQDLVKHFKSITLGINSIQPWNSEFDPTFRWGGRVEFLEQLFDLRNDSLYIVEPCTTASVKNSRIEEYEDARIHIIQNPVICSGNPLINSNMTIATVDDIPYIEDSSKNASYYISSFENLHNLTNFSSQEYLLQKVIPVRETPLVIQVKESYTALFYDPVWAEKYRSAISKFIKDYFGAISTITSRF